MEVIGAITSILQRNKNLNNTLNKVVQRTFAICLITLSTFSLRSFLNLFYYGEDTLG